MVLLLAVLLYLTLFTIQARQRRKLPRFEELERATRRRAASADLADAGYADVEEVRTAEEDLMFSLPKELRRDAAGIADARALGGRARN
jgi:hypothetical protein